ncbi:GNAT family protein [Paenibacillus sp. Marseille-Q4541]|uniref:GNAT family N-acetyltransferase n=1 Tax=Paenibacillus sp. Marseille-Q4541 TaxID=2831522 RepID=UPI001BA96DD8|nr:GNAT family protein [Paenibacillus sp. Marseille-Q4541]
MTQANIVFRVMPMTEEQAAEISTWQYDPPYNIYGWLPWDQMKALEIEFGDPNIRARQYLSVLIEQDEPVLCGFAQLFPMEGVTRLGLGMRPSLCGNGHGTAFVSSIVHEAKQRNPGHIIDLEVLTWNTRAIRAYEKAGFIIDDTYERLTPDGSKLFHCMIYEGTDQI